MITAENGPKEGVDLQVMEGERDRCSSGAGCDPTVNLEHGQVDNCL